MQLKNNNGFSLDANGTGEMLVLSLIISGACTLGVMALKILSEAMKRDDLPDILEKSKGIRNAKIINIKDAAAKRTITSIQNSRTK